MGLSLVINKLVIRISTALEIKTHTQKMSVLIMAENMLFMDAGLTAVTNLTSGSPLSAKY